MPRKRCFIRVSISKHSFGLDAIHIDDLFKAPSKQINFIPGLRLPLFDGGRLNANLKIPAPPATC